MVKPTDSRENFAIMDTAQTYKCIMKGFAIAINEDRNNNTR